MSGMEKWKHLRIPFADIENGTQNFKRKFGTGGYGSVYEGKLFINGEYLKVAVKRSSEKHGQGLKEYLTELDLLWNQEHKNIITLVGFCDEKNEKIIVYEYAERGSLDYYFKFRNASYTLAWIQRLKIVVDVARGLDHLHNQLPNKQVIIHRDIKSSNILLDQEWCAKISDFGLSKSTSSGLDRSTVVTYACGTLGYVEPELKKFFLANKKADVYSFGMVLCEVFCGTLCKSQVEKDKILSAEVFEEYYTEDKLDKIIDPGLKEQTNPNALSKFSELAYKCLQAREQRPSIDVVKKELEETLKIQMQHEETVIPEETIDEEYWNKKLPNRYQRYIQRSDKPLHYTNKKELYLRLSEGFLCDNGQLWFSICKSNDEICSILPATQILHDDIEYEHLDALSLYESRFPEVIILGYASSYSFTCTLQLQMLSPQNMYACYLVFKFEHNIQLDGNRLFIAEYGLGHHLLGNVRVHMNSRNNNPTMKPESDNQEPGTEGLEKTNDHGLEYDNVESWMEERKDGWMEIMLTKPLEKLEDHSTLKVRLWGGSFGGIIVEGIEFRPYI